MTEHTNPGLLLSPEGYVVGQQIILVDPDLSIVASVTWSWIRAFAVLWDEPCRLQEPPRLSYTG